MQKKQLQMIGIVAFLLLFVGGGSILNLSLDGGYISGFQGPKAEFKGVSYKSLEYTAGQRQEASQLSLQSNLLFDADENDRDLPNIEGEMTTVFVPEESLEGYTTWIPAEWFKRNALINNPQRTYAWNISTGVNTTKVYRMEQWVMKWYVSFSAHWDGREVVLDWANLGQNYRNYYANAEIWFEFDIRPTWYIEGGGTAYFAVGKIQLAQSVLKESEDNTGTKHDADTLLSVIPESGGSALYIYSSLFGTGAAEVTEKTYQGKRLNPALFRDKVYAKISLANFGLRSWNEFGTVKTHGDVATFDFDLTVFVIGEWDVQDIQKIPDDFGRTTKIDEPYSLADLLKDPRFQASFTLLVLGGIFIFLLIFAPWVLFAIVGLFRSGRRK